MADRELSGSPAVNPKAGRTAIKDRAIHHKVVSTQPIRAIITKSIEDNVAPKASLTIK